MKKSTLALLKAMVTLMLCWLNASGLLGFAIAAMMLRCVGVLYYAPLLPESWRATAAGLFAALAVLAFLFLPRRGRTALGAVMIFGIVVVVFLRIPASNDRDWLPDVAQLPYATIQGDRITFHNVRNFAYRSETDFDPRWETSTYDLNKLISGCATPIGVVRGST